MPQLQLMIGGRWAPSVGPWGDLKWSTCLEGSDDCTWRMDQLYRRLRGRQSVRIWDGPNPVWSGVLSRPAADGVSYTAQGLWKDAYNFLAIDVANNPTSSVDDAIDGCISRGLPWTRGMSFDTGTPAAMSADLQGEIPKLGDLLDASSDRLNRYWKVNAAGEAVWYSRPASPDIMVVPDQPMNADDDDYATSLWGVRKSNTGVKTLVPSVSDADAAARWVTPREELVDLSEFGNMTAGVATDVLAGALTKRKARLGYSTGLTLTGERVSTPGGVQAYLPAVRAGMLARALVQWDDVAELNGRTTRDFMIARTVHSASENVIQIDPEGLAPRNAQAVLRRLKRQHRRDQGRLRWERV